MPCVKTWIMGFKPITARPKRSRVYCMQFASVDFVTPASAILDAYRRALANPRQRMVLPSPVSLHPPDVVIAFDRTNPQHRAFMRAFWSSERVELCW